METRLNSSYKQIKTQGCIDAQLVITIYKTVVCVLNGLIFFIIFYGGAICSALYKLSKFLFSNKLMLSHNNYGVSITILLSLVNQWLARTCGRQEIKV